jgi:hypothetical protein
LALPPSRSNSVRVTRRDVMACLSDIMLQDGLPDVVENG